MGENSGSQNADGMEWGGTRVFQIMNPGFMMDFVGRHKAWATGSRIPGKHWTIVEAMYNKKSHDSLTQISSKRTTCYRSVNEHHMRPERGTKYTRRQRRLKGRADLSNQGRALRSHQNVKMDSCKIVFMRVLLRMTASRVSCVALIARIWYQPFGTICSDGPGVVSL